MILTIFRIILIKFTTFQGISELFAYLNYGIYTRIYRFHNFLNSYDLDTGWNVSKTLFFTRLTVNSLNSLNFNHFLEFRAKTKETPKRKKLTDYGSPRSCARTMHFTATKRRNYQVVRLKKELERYKRIVHEFAEV